MASQEKVKHGESLLRKISRDVRYLAKIQIIIFVLDNMYYLLLYSKLEHNKTPILYKGSNGRRVALNKR